MGFPARSPIPARFKGPIYMPFGCSRSPVTVAVPNSNRSILLGAVFWPDPPPGAPERPSDAGAACARPVDGARAADGPGDGAVAGAVAGAAVTGVPGVAGVAGAFAGAFDGSAPGSPAPECAVAWAAGFTEDAGGGGGACCCADTRLAANHSALKF